jgi:hypothetical protein
LKNTFRHIFLALDTFGWKVVRQDGYLDERWCDWNGVTGKGRWPSWAERRDDARPKLHLVEKRDEPDEP